MGAPRRAILGDKAGHHGCIAERSADERRHRGNRQFDNQKFRRRRHRRQLQHLPGHGRRHRAGIGANIEHGASFDARDGAVLRNNGGWGVQANDGASVFIGLGTVEDNGDGLEAGTGGHVRLYGSSSVVGNHIGIGAYRNGTAFVDAGAVVTNNSSDGIYVYSGGSAEVRGGAIVGWNGGDGIDVESGNLTLGDAALGPAIIQHNKSDGIFLRTNSVASFGNSANRIIGNTLFGIACSGAPSNPLIYGTIGTVSGNGSGQISCKKSP